MNHELLTMNNELRTTNYQLNTSDERSIFMQNEPNFPDAQMNATTFITKDYEKKTLGQRGKNEPKTNPTCRGVASGEAGSKPISEAKNAAFDD